MKPSSAGRPVLQGAFLDRDQSKPEESLSGKSRFSAWKRNQADTGWDRHHRAVRRSTMREHRARTTDVREHTSADEQYRVRCSGVRSGSRSIASASPSNSFNRQPKSLSASAKWMNKPAR